MLFPNFDIALHYCLEFGRFSDFAIRKKRIEKNHDGSIRSRCMDCEYSRKSPSLVLIFMIKVQKRLNALGILIIHNQ
jgi:hypothetical protein